MKSRPRYVLSVCLLFTITMITVGFKSRSSVVPGNELSRDTETGNERQCVADFLSQYEQSCRQTMRPKREDVVSKITRLTSWMTLSDDSDLCPCVPTGLHGFVDDVLETSNTSESDLAVDGGVWLSGGRWMPDWCVARQRVAIIVPLKHREHHLKVFLRHIRPVLQRQLLDYTIFVVEQLEPQLFNKGSLYNIGFIETRKRSSFDCYILHDVDILPLDDRNFYTCSSMPRHLGAYIKKYNFTMLYDCLIGGIQAFTAQQFEAINGYSNEFIGWGGEDDDLLRRIWAQNLTVSARYPLCVSRLEMMNHTRDADNQPHNEMLGTRYRPRLYHFDGINTVHYELVSTDEHRLYTRLGVRLLTPQSLPSAARIFNMFTQFSPLANMTTCRVNERRRFLSKLHQAAPRTRPSHTF